MTFEAVDPYGYGLIILGADSTVLSIVVELEATDEQRRVRECNSGTFVLEAAAVLPLLPELPRSAKGELYLTDVVGLLRERGRVVAAHVVPEAEAMGVNTVEQLAVADAEARRRSER